MENKNLMEINSPNIDSKSKSHTTLNRPDRCFGDQNTKMANNKVGF